MMALPQSLEKFAGRPTGGQMDVLSEVLKVVKLQGAMFYNGEFSSPWSFCSPPSSTVAPYVAPAARHVIIYHLLTEGRASARLVDGQRIILAAGDIVIFPHGDAHILENGPPTKAVDMAKELARIFSQGLKRSCLGGGGEITKFVCGFMACEPRLSQVFLSGLPPVFKVSIRNDASGRWLENSIRFSVNEADASRAGGEAVLAKLSEVLFVETLRAYIAHLPAEQTGWLAGARDSEVGKTLALMHRNPAQPWTIASLAKEAGVCHARCWQSASAITSTSLQWRTSLAGDFSWERRCLLRPVIRWHRSHPKSAMNPKLLLTARSSVSLKFLQRVSAASRGLLIRLSRQGNPG
jgi:Cupin